MTDAYYGEIRAFGFDYAPENWAFCNGQQVPIEQNPALYSVIGKTYGGDGKRYFNLPNLQGRVPIGMGGGPGLTARNLGDMCGQASVTVMAQHLPPHTHVMNAFFPRLAADLASAPSPGARLSYDAREVPGPATPLKAFSNADRPNTTLASESLSGFPGGGGTNPNVQPYQVLNFCICLEGEWPPKP